MTFIQYTGFKLSAFFRITIYSGSERIVLLIPFLGVVIKFPKSRKGSRINLAEWIFWRKYRNPFCQETLFSFRLPSLKEKCFYWINVQRLAYQPCDMDPDEFLIKTSILTRRMAEYDLHHFKVPANFCYDKNGRLKMLDYGHVQTRQVIKAYGYRLYTGFDKNIRQTIDDLMELIDALEGIRDIQLKKK